MSSATRRLSGELSRLKASNLGIAGRASGLFFRYVDHGVQQLRWMDTELVAANRLANTASEVLDIVARYMKEYKLPMNFTRWGGR